jgi:hypothetical protein
MAARDRLARRATRSHTAVPWQRRSRRDLQRGKADASAGPATGGRRITMQGNDVQSDGVQHMAVFPLGKLRSRPSWCAGGSRLMDIKGRRGEGNGRSPAALRTARGEFGGGQVRADLDPRGGGEALMARQVGRRSGEMKAAVIARRIRKEQLRGCADRVSAAHVHGP